MPSVRLSRALLILSLIAAACGSVTPPSGSDAAPTDAPIGTTDAGVDSAPPVDAPPEAPPTAARQLSVLSGRVAGGGLVMEVEVSALPATPATGGGNTLRRATPVAP